MLLHGLRLHDFHDFQLCVLHLYLEVENQAHKQLVQIGHFQIVIVKSHEILVLLLDLNETLIYLSSYAKYLPDIYVLLEYLFPEFSSLITRKLNHFLEFNVYFLEFNHRFNLSLHFER